MIKIAITNLGKYNEGSLIFKWLELPCTDEELAEALEEIGINERYEEYFISDYESDFDGLKIDEYDNLQELNTLAERAEAVDAELLAAILEAETSDLSAALEIAESGDVQFYESMTLEELAEEFVEEGLFSTETLLRYIDFERLGRDLSFDGYTETDAGVLFRG